MNPAWKAYIPPGAVPRKEANIVFLVCSIVVLMMIASCVGIYSSSYYSCAVSSDYVTTLCYGIPNNNGTIKRTQFGYWQEFYARALVNNTKRLILIQDWGAYTIPHYSQYESGMFGCRMNPNMRSEHHFYGTLAYCPAFKFLFNILILGLTFFGLLVYIYSLLHTHMFDGDYTNKHTDV